MLISSIIFKEVNIKPLVTKSEDSLNVTCMLVRVPAGIEIPEHIHEEQVDILFKEMDAQEGYQLSIDLPAQTVTTDSGHVFSFELDEFRKDCLLNGLDEIGLTLQNADKIKAVRWRLAQPLRRLIKRAQAITRTTPTPKRIIDL